MKVFSAIGLIVCLSLSLMAQAPQRRRNPAQMDTDGDGKISSGEWQGRAEAFKRLDADNDGFVTRDELNQLRRRNGNRGAAMDANKDGKITRDEWKGMPEVFDRLDANKDGSITPDERPRNGQRNGQPAAGRRGQRGNSKGRSKSPLLMELMKEGSCLSSDLVHVDVLCLRAFVV